jgi:hypothetical protein
MGGANFSSIQGRKKARYQKACGGRKQPSGRIAGNRLPDEWASI